MFDVGGGELILIILVTIILFGPKKIPEMMQMAAKGMKKVRDAQATFKDQMDDLKHDIEKSVDVEDTPKQRDFSNQPKRDTEHLGFTVKEPVQNLDDDNFIDEEIPFDNNAIPDIRPDSEIDKIEKSNQSKKSKKIDTKDNSQESKS